MDRLLSQILDRLERQEAPPQAMLARLGAPDPAGTGEALLRAAGLSELAGSLEVWGPALLLSAQPGLGAERLAELSVQLLAVGAPAIEASQLPALAALLGTGDVLADWLRQRPDWAAGLVGKLADEGKPPPPVWQEIRDAHALGLLRIAAGQLQGAPLQMSFERITDLANGCMASALECASGETGIAPPGVFAWGRFGAAEPGISCPLELLLVDAERSAGIERERAAECEHLVARLLEELPQGFEAGLTYSLGPVHSADSLTAGACVQPMSKAVGLWRSRRQAGARAPLLALRQLGGRASVGEEFLSQIGKLLDLDVEAEEGEGARASRRRELADFELRDEDLLAGPCGIGALERVVRALQISSGQRNDGSILDALQTLERKALLEESRAQGLAAAYSWLRRAEHALGLSGAATPVLPVATEGQLGLARTMGYDDPDGARALRGFLYDWRAVRDEVADAISCRSSRAAS